MWCTVATVLNAAVVMAVLNACPKHKLGSLKCVRLIQTRGPTSGLSRPEMQHAPRGPEIFRSVCCEKTTRSFTVIQTEYSTQESTVRSKTNCAWKTEGIIQISASGLLNY
jgi:hypothetical protein